MKTIKMSCGKEGCSVTEYIMPTGITAPIKKPVVKPQVFKKAA